MTYASRTQHVRLARHINELLQQKSLEDSDLDEVEEEEDDADKEWDHRNGHGGGGGYTRAVRSVSTRMGPPSKTHLLPPLKMSSKFSRQKLVEYVLSVLCL